MESALGEAAFLTGCERNSDVVRMTSYAPLLAHIPAKGWAQNLIELNPAHVNPTVNYEVERLFSTHLGDTTYAVSIEQTASRPAKHLYVSATGHDGDDACRYIKIVNTSDSPVDVTLEIARGLAGLGRLAIATGAFGGDDVKRQSDGENHYRIPRRGFGGDCAGTSGLHIAVARLHCWR